MAIPQARNLSWSLEFVADTLASGQGFRILTLVDAFTTECLGLVVDTSLSGLAGNSRALMNHRQRLAPLAVNPAGRPTERYPNGLHSKCRSRVSKSRARRHEMDDPFERSAQGEQPLSAPSVPPEVPRTPVRKRAQAKRTETAQRIDKSVIAVPDPPR
jgi:hypothetical protein